MAETQPGGYYIGTDGTAHDANGNPVELVSLPADPVVEAAPDPIVDAPAPKGKGKAK